MFTENLSCECMETNQMSLNWEMDWLKYYDTPIRWTIFTNKKKQTTHISNNIDEFRMHYTKWNKPYSKSHCIIPFIWHSRIGSEKRKLISVLFCYNSKNCTLKWVNFHVSQLYFFLIKKGKANISRSPPLKILFKH